MPTSNRLRLILESHKQDSIILGTTFPPSNSAPLKRFHSESNLNNINPEEDLKSLFNSDDDQTIEENCPDDKDSDLFFDFDIGSPTTEDFDEENIHDFRRSSNDSCPSTAFGSTSSGLYSDDPDIKSVSEIESQGFCIEPEDWLASNFNDIMGQKTSKSPEKESSPEKEPSPEPEKIDVSSDETLDGTSEVGQTKICIGKF